MKGNEIFGWKNVLKFYSIGDLFKDSIIPMVVSLILLAISISIHIEPIRDLRTKD